VSDLFGKKGRAWRAELELPIEERETLDSGLRQIDFLDGEIASVDRVIAHDALNWPEARRLMTVPGVNLIVAVSFLAAVGNIVLRRLVPKRQGCPRVGPSMQNSGPPTTLSECPTTAGPPPARLVHADLAAAPTLAAAHPPLTGDGGRGRARRARASSWMRSPAPPEYDDQVWSSFGTTGPPHRSNRSWHGPSLSRPGESASADGFVTAPCC
jgi:transposase